MLNYWSDIIVMFVIHPVAFYTLVFYSQALEENIKSVNQISGSGEVGDPC